jgi:hypothetical protein
MDVGGRKRAGAKHGLPRELLGRICGRPLMISQSIGNERHDATQKK